MANPHRGEVELLAGDERLVLRFTMNTLCALEEKFGLPIAQVGQMIEKPEDFKVATARTFLWAGLLHANPALTEDEAGAIEVEGGIPVVMGKVMEAFVKAFPSQKPGTAPRPQKAAKA